VSIAVRDYITGQALLPGQFKSMWEQIGGEAKVADATQTF